MEKKVPVLKICMFGRTIITYGGQPVTFGRKGITKVQKLLMIMCYSGEKGMVRNKLLECLYGKEEILDAANNLRVTSHRLRKQMREEGLPDYDYITVRDGMYYFQAPMEIEVDALRFQELVFQAKEASEEDKHRLLLEACELYKGEFFEDYSEAEWVLVENSRLKMLYEESLLWLCGYLKEKGEYDEILRLCTAACNIYPLDEWQAVKMECYIAQGRFADARKEYKDTEKLLIEELGVTPSDRMLKQLEVLRERMVDASAYIHEIKERLKETEAEEGAYYCSLPSFRDEYCFACRIMERKQIGMYLMLCTVMNEKGFPQENTEILNAISKELQHTIKHSLRRCDTFTRFSPCQFLILLIGTDEESCKGIFDRISNNLSGVKKEFRNFLKWDVFPIEEMDKIPEQKK